MFDWLDTDEESTDLEHAKLRQEERDAAFRRDPLEAHKVLDESNLIVEEISPVEFQRQLSQLEKPNRKN